ncbi:(2E,6E)-farnesyl diphosphate synthase [Psychrosphaera sp. F3M07]|uniref:(2E,6E)-farnesyl diphosphate synthase n=1 Tax=Psychrosphaera sp. F3M07 TaxID=2841560 RepID=UPI001C085437|nr:(2E,6E)-farnesyl diphosphate synthase [Psychrosphaera sp. F3M07]MBU2917964.1 (2E,6E)-farnesyl diphosphate synthase [Psychrosphaera sp. F3M07]
MGLPEQDSSNIGLQDAIVQYKTRIEQFLTQELSAATVDEIILKEAMEYSLLLGGKRLRPFLVYATGGLFKADLHDLDAPAAALEAIHTYSLIHDDLPAMDDDELRRGSPTCHIKFDEATAILAGDTLQSFAFNVLSSHDYQQVTAPQIVKMFSLLTQAATDMCAGQSIDLQQTNTLNTTELETDVLLINLKEMHRLKTGALIKSAVLLGATCGNANEQEIEILSQYADAIGLAFQVWDDVLDITSDTLTLGKPQGSDVAANKTTYPALLGLDGARIKAKNLITQAVHALQQLPYNTQQLEQLAYYIIERDH